MDGAVDKSSLGLKEIIKIYIFKILYSAMYNMVLKFPCALQALFPNWFLFCRIHADVSLYTKPRGEKYLDEQYMPQMVKQSMVGWVQVRQVWWRSPVQVLTHKLNPS